MYKSQSLFRVFRNDANAQLQATTPPPFFERQPSGDVAIDIPSSSLTQIVKHKNLSHLSEYGGLEGLASTIKSNLKMGIRGDVEDITRRKEAFGSNTYAKPPPKNSLVFLWGALTEPLSFLLLLVGALLLGFGLKEWYEGVSIFVIVSLEMAVKAISNFRQKRQFVKLSKLRNNIQANVMRNGEEQKVSIFEIVVGDVVCLKSDDQVPADGLFIDGHSLLVDESIMTEKSNPVEVDFSHNPFLFSGTKVIAGNGRMLVISVGKNTAWGEMLSEIIDSNKQIPPKFRLNKLTSSIGIVVLFVAFFAHVAFLIRHFTGKKNCKKGNIPNSVLEIIAAAVTILVDAIPGGLPVAVTLTLAYSMKRMKRNHEMVGKLSACSTMGFTTTICTDKTGTLTLNKMKVAKFLLGQQFIEEIGTSSVATTVVELLHQGVGLNTTGSVSVSASGSEFKFSGSPTEKAILSWAVSVLKLDMEALKKSSEILRNEAFNSTKKRSCVLMRKKEQNTANLHMKGAAEMVLAMCSNYYDVSGTIKALDDVERMKFVGIIDGMAASGLRCIAFAHKEISVDENEEENPQIEENNLTLLGLVGLMDPCRPSVKETIKKCQDAGVKVKMITGDNIVTARAIATECGILEPNQDMESGAVVEGKEFRSYTMEEQMEKVDLIRVVARSSPRDKLLMVQCLKQKGHVVAFIGDGTNDAPALKEADIGLSMGIQGTEVAKGCSDIVISDDSFGSVATLLRWGRFVYTNVQRFILLQLIMNVSALVIDFVASVSAKEEPFLPIQFLWVNLVMNALGALPLATEKPKNELMEKPPVGQTNQLITNDMWWNLISQACYQIVILLTLKFRGKAIFNVSSKLNDTLIFNVFMLCQVFNVFNVRKLKKKNVFERIHKSKLFLVIVGLTIVLQVVMVEFLKKFADTERLNWWQWGVCIGFGSVSWPIGWLVKWIRWVFNSRRQIPSDTFFDVLPHTSSSSTASEIDPASTANSGDKVLSRDEVANYGDEDDHSGNEKMGTIEQLHTTSLGEANMRVSIDMVKVREALLPIPITGEVAIIGEAVGCHTEVDNEVASKKPATMEDEVTSKDVDCENNLKTFATFAEHTDKDRAIYIPLEKDIFGEEVDAHLQKVDMEYIYQMNPVSAICIMIYIRQLYQNIKAINVDRRFAFGNPCLLSGISHDNETSKAEDLASRLEDVKKDQLLLIPCNTGYHWVLCVIDLSSTKVYLMDSVNNEIPKTLISPINKAFKIYDLKKGRRSVSPDWKEVECPKQTGNVKCGFYVMKYMKDVIRDESILGRGNFNGKSTYTDAEINEVRVEWIKSVKNYI